MNEAFIMLIPAMGMFLTFATIVVLFWLKAGTDREKVAARTRVQNQLIEKFANSSEFVAFVQSPEGQSFLSAPGATMFAERGLSAMKWGIFIGTPGVGFLLLSALFAEEFAIPGVLLVSIGLGLFGSGILTNRVARSSASVRETLPQQS